MTTTFEFTDTQDVKSSAVDTLTYNENTRELVVDLHDDLYKYDGVPRSRFEQILHAPSVGRDFHDLKKNYGPADYLGPYGSVTFVPVDKATKPTFPPAAQPSVLASKSGVATNVPTASTSASQTFSLTPSVNVGTEGKATYTVDFVPAGADEPREYTAQGVDSVEEAIAALNEVADMLGVTLTVKGVYVEFE